jgi:peroxiredoxin
MYPHERSLVARMKAKPFTILGVNSDPAVRYKKAIKENNITWPSFWDGGKTGGPIATEWAVRGWPTIYILDAKGVIRYKNARGKAMDEAVDALLQEMEAE